MNKINLKKKIKELKETEIMYYNRYKDMKACEERDRLWQIENNLMRQRHSLMHELENV